METNSNTSNNPFEVGDLALHINNQLDARPVEAVEGDKIRLRIGSLVTEPIPASNYHRIPAKPFRRAGGGPVDFPRRRRPA